MTDTTRSQSEDATIGFLVAVTEEESATEGTKGIFSRGEREIAYTEISVNTLRVNMETTLNGLRQTFDGLDPLGSKFPLKEVQVSFEVSASGKVNLLGTGAEVAGTGGITLTFGRE
jgi:hypothetical protein